MTPVPPPMTRLSVAGVTATVATLVLAHCGSNSRAQNCVARVSAQTGPGLATPLTLIAHDWTFQKIHNLSIAFTSGSIHC